jgi:uracil-DNA glycosylase family 4
MQPAAALRLQIEWGADEALQSAPVDRLQAPPVSAVAHAAVQPAAAGPEPAIVAQARAAAANAASFEALQAALTALDPGGLARTAGAMAFAAGDAAADLVIVGDVAGEEDDRSGSPFSGPAGQLLDAMLQSIGLDRARVRLTNLLPWRPPGGRPPSDLEIACCLPFLHRHLALVQPQWVVAMGSLTTRALLGRDAAAPRKRGNWVAATVPGLPSEVKVLPTFHPAQLRLRPDSKQLAWADWRLLLRTMKKE